MTRRLNGMPLPTAPPRRYPVLRPRRRHDTAFACLWLLVAGGLAVAAGFTDITDERGRDRVWYYAATFFLVTFFTLLTQLLRKLGLPGWARFAVVLSVSGGFAWSVWEMAPNTPFAVVPPSVELLGAASIAVAVVGLALVGPWRRRRQAPWLR